jgi:hypothetical protein
MCQSKEWSAFCARVLPEIELTKVGGHLVQCDICHQQFIDTLSHQREDPPVSFALSPQFWARHEHLDYEQLVDFVEDKLEPTDREVINLHLKLCATCEEDVRSLVAFQEQIEPEMVVSYAPTAHEVPESWSTVRIQLWQAVAWKPVYVVIVVLIGIAIVRATGFLLKLRPNNQQAVQPSPVTPGPSPDSRADNGPSSPNAPPTTPGEQPNNDETNVALLDGEGTIVVDTSGNITGLDDVPGATRDLIAKAVLSQRLERPSILNELGGKDAGLRGSTNNTRFKLIAPSRTVIVSDRPSFKWENTPGASSYQVYVADRDGNVVAKSNELQPEQTEWKLTQALKRNEIYSWTVVAVIDGKEVVSPGPSAPEMKFQVLSVRDVQQLHRVKKTRSHLALGVFYANVGLTLEAQQEFRKLVQLNPKSRLANNLLQSIQ